MTVRSSLLYKYSTSFVVLVSLTLIVSGLLGLYYTYEESKAARLGLQREKALVASARIDAFIDGLERDLGWLRQARIDTASLPALQSDYRKLLNLQSAITTLYLVDQKGREQLLVSRLEMDVLASAADHAADARFIGAREAGKYFSDVTFRNGSEPYMSMAVSGIAKAGGVTIAELNLKFVREVIEAVTLSPLGRTYIVDRRGRLIAHPDMSLVLRKSDFSALAQVAASLHAVGEPRTAGVMTARNHQGEEVLVAFTRIPGLKWHVFVEEPLSEAFSPLWASLYRTGLLLLAGLAVAIAFGIAFARRLVTPIRALELGAARVASGDLQQRIEVRSGDELERLAEEFNVMAARLRESYATLEGKVEERTRDLTAALELQTATSEVLKTISRSRFDLERVLQEVVHSVVKLGRAEGAGLFVKQRDGGYRLTAVYSDDARIGEFIRAHRGEIEPSSGTASERAIALGVPYQIEDVSDEASYPWREAGFRTVLAVPVLREGIPVGVAIAVRVDAKPFRESEIGVITTFADQAGIAIENVRLFQEIQDKSVELERANRYKSEFLANVSHELRTPLNAIIGFSEVLRERMFGEINDKQAEYLDDIFQSGKHLLSLINDILNLSKIEAGKMEVDLKRLDLNEALQSAMHVVHETAKNRGIRLEYRADPGVGEWVADSKLLRQIMLNLLSNAIKFTAPGGEVAVSVKRAQAGVEVAVTDTGTGIAPADCEWIFEPFRRVRTTQAESVEGTGLGLALTRRFVELQGGRIHLRSTLGVGSTFSFVLPEVALEAA